MSKLIESEDAGSGTVSLKVYLKYFKHAGMLMTLLAFGTNILFQVAAVGSNSKEVVQKCPLY